jgi:hypothetical protein
MRYLSRFFQVAPLSLVALFSLLGSAPRASAQAAIFVEQPFGLFGRLNPTGHTAIYVEHICADTPVHLRMCNPGEVGAVISRYHDMGGYDWVAIPLIPYLYALEDASKVPDEADKETVQKYRDHYKEVVLGEFGDKLPKGNAFHDGWVQLVGTAYDRRTYAFRFATTHEQDVKLVELLNSRPNKSHFNLEYQNCADFDRFVLGTYFHKKHFRRTILPDLGMTTPKHVAFQLERYARKHPEIKLTVLEIPQVPGSRKESVAIRGVDESLIMDGYIIPIAVLNPYLAGGLVADYLIEGRHKLLPKDVPKVGPDNLDVLTKSTRPAPVPAPGTESGTETDPVASPAAGQESGQEPNKEPMPAAGTEQVPAAVSSPAPVPAAGATSAPVPNSHE